MNSRLGLTELNHCHEELWMSTFFLFSFLFTGAQLVFEKRAEAIKPEERWYRQYRDRGDELSQEESLHETRTHSHKAEVDTHT